MSVLQRLYPHEKALVLNAIYDALDVMGMSIAQADSVRGTLLLYPEASREKQLRLMLSPDAKNERTKVEILTADEATDDEAWANTLLDEIASTIERTGLEI